MGRPCANDGEGAHNAPEPITSQGREYARRGSQSHHRRGCTQRPEAPIPLARGGQSRGKKSARAPRPDDGRALVIANTPKWANGFVECVSEPRYHAVARAGPLDPIQPFFIRRLPRLGRGCALRVRPCAERRRSAKRKHNHPIGPSWEYTHTSCV
eukprot:1193355-Prorocentrum_minimum.AAC.5